MYWQFEALRYGWTSCSTTTPSTHLLWIYYLISQVNDLFWPTLSSFIDRFFFTPNYSNCFVEIKFEIVLGLELLANSEYSLGQLEFVGQYVELQFSMKFHRSPAKLWPSEFVRLTLHSFIHWILLAVFIGHWANLLPWSLPSSVCHDFDREIFHFIIKKMKVHSIAENL